ncbi:protein FAR-RED IMPAIRED RESPONSE 1-like [Vigna radiata var. radiata]|uniref:Protein FAR1-RELATED SEQUENCE n=1 Tax=Vigna radiata var. radiata TaxID=3916 RepID=A0A1S3V092_VIGRR|nr:protein FAR-RED IMPAIRED RESPONSE 1-like [Vigna radiata var. radiata]
MIVVGESNEEFNTVDDSCLELVPTLNMCFDTMQEAKKFYSDYGKRCGFGVGTITSKKDDNNEVYYLRLVCSREGKYVSNIRPEVKTLPSQTNQCRAGITIARKDDKWVVRTVAVEHSHELCSQTSNLFRANRKLNMHAKHTLEVNDEAGVHINKSFLSMVGEAGGYENMQFMERDARNFIGQHRSTTLLQFVVQYDNVLKFKAQKEIEADFYSFNTTVACGSQSPIERQFQVEYTHAKFEEVQIKFQSRMNCFFKDTVKDCISNKYTIEEECMWDGKSTAKYYHVEFDPLTNDTSCSCLLFEFRGIICRHCLFVLGQEDLQNVPSKYVLHRCSKNIRRKHTLIRAAYSSLNQEPKMQRYQSLCKWFYEIAEAACESEFASHNWKKN